MKSLLTSFFALLLIVLVMTPTTPALGATAVAGDLASPECTDAGADSYCEAPVATAVAYVRHVTDWPLHEAPGGAGAPVAQQVTGIDQASTLDRMTDHGHQPTREPIAKSTHVTYMCTVTGGVPCGIGEQHPGLRAKERRLNHA